MRTRSTSKQSQEPSGSKNVAKDVHDLQSGGLTTMHQDNVLSVALSSISKDAVGKFLKRSSSHKASHVKRRKGQVCHGESNDMIEDRVKEIEMSEASEMSYDLLAYGRDTKETISAGKEVHGIIHHSVPAVTPNTEETDEPDWEDGSVSVSEVREGYPNNMEREVTVEINDSPSSAKQKVIRRASVEEKELAELVHKVHLLCLVARGRLVDRACDDPLIQASLLSLLPSSLLDIAKTPKLTANALKPLVDWFHGTFHVRRPSSLERSIASCLAYTLETHEGTAEEIAALSVALFRALNLTARFVSILDVASRKPEADASECSNLDANDVGMSIFSKGVASLSQISAAYPGQSSLQKTNSSGGFVHESPKSCSGTEMGESKLTSKTKQYNNFLDELNLQTSDSTDDICRDKNVPCATKHDKGSKRKGDLEFELQLEMALSATATSVHESSLGSDLKGANDTASSVVSPLKALKRIKTKGSTVSTQGSSAAVWSRKVGPPMYWAEIFCSGETLTGRWVHVDAANAIIDGEQKVESAAAACRRSLRYVVAFAGNGAKDVTRRFLSLNCL